MARAVSLVPATRRAHRGVRAAVLVAVVTTTLVLGVASTAVAETTATVSIDGGYVGTSLFEAVRQVASACRTSPVVDVAVRQPSSRWKIAVDCSERNGTPSGIQAQLVAEASRRHRAGARADAVVTLQETLPYSEGLTYDHDELVWSFAQSANGRCERQLKEERVERMLAAGFRSSGETPEHWTLIEAVRMTGQCPDRLSDLYRAVARAGNPTAANAVKELLERDSATLPTRSVPRGVSAQVVEGRPVFMVRRGDHVTTLLTNVQHMAGERTLWWCPREELFVSPTHGEAFDLRGAPIGGPARRGLDQFRTTVDDDTVTVHLHDVVKGSDRPDSLGAVGGNQAWNTGPGSFCSGAIEHGTPETARR